MLAHYLQRCPALSQHWLNVCASLLTGVYFLGIKHILRENAVSTYHGALNNLVDYVSKQNTLTQCWASVADDKPMLNQNLVDMSSVLCLSPAGVMSYHTCDS